MSVSCPASSSLEPSISGYLRLVDAIGPELVLGVAGQSRQKRQHHSRWAWAAGLARLAQKAQRHVLTQGTGGPAIRLDASKQAMGLLVMDGAPIQQGDQPIPIQQGPIRGSASRRP